EQEPDLPCQDPSPLDRLISREDVELVRRALERVPVAYRLPLVLFYREQKSIEAVARALDLTTDNVHQRLSRGRRMLQQRVLQLLDSVLGNTRPGKAFTAATMALLFGAGVAPARAAASSGRIGRGSSLARAWLAGPLVGAALLVTVSGAWS